MSDYVRTTDGMLFNDVTLQCIGINANDSAQLEANGIFPVRNEYPKYNEAFHHLRPLELKKVDGEYVRCYELVENDIEIAKSVLREYATSQRWKHETGGIEIDGMKVLTGVEDQNRIDSAINGMTAAGLSETSFKAANGWATVSIEELRKLQIVMVQFVEACFAQERALHEVIDACGSVAELQALDLDSGWPDPKVA